MYVSITLAGGVVDWEDGCVWLPPPMRPAPPLPARLQPVWASLHLTGVSWTSTCVHAEVVISAAANRTGTSARRAQTAPGPKVFAARAPRARRLRKNHRMLDLGGTVGQKNNRT